MCTSPVWCKVCARVASAQVKGAHLLELPPRMCRYACAHMHTYIAVCTHTHAHLGWYLHTHAHASRNMQTHSHAHDHAFTEASVCPRRTHMHVRAPASTMCAHPPTFACTGRTLCSHVRVHTHIHTRAVTHTYCVLTCRNLCAHFICGRTSIQHTGVPVHMCTHVPTHTHALAHVCTPTHAHVPVASLTLPAAGRLYLWCPSVGSSSRRQAGFHLTASASPGARLSLPAVDLGLRHRPFSRLAALPPLSRALPSSSKT